MSQNFKYRSSRSGQNRRPRTQNKSRQPKKAFIHPSKLVKKAKPVTNEVYLAKNNFKDFNIIQLIKDNLINMGFDQPSPIQDQAIPLGLEFKDIVGIANTGTGKTAAFAVPVLNRLLTEPNSKAIIMAPTRELAEQIEQQCRIIGKNSGLDGALLIGGTSMTRQLKELKFKPRIIIGTPGRIKDHIERKSLNISDCNISVLDEVDRMLDMGFVHDITEILSHTNQNRQSFYFSATLDYKVSKIIERFSDNPVQITVTTGETGENIDQNIVTHSSADKLDKLHELLIQNTTKKTIIFDDTHRLVERLSKELSARGFSADSIHGGRTQSQRQRVLKKFKSNEINVLVATDVAARGLDVSDISHVINYSLPQSYDDYIHRIGRTGRAGRTGYALTFIEK